MPEIPTAPPPHGQSGPAAVPQRHLGDVEVEVCDKQNSNHLWNPTQARLRGKWDWSRLARGQTSERGLHKMPVLPGMMIAVSPRQRRAEVYDPLSLPENARLLLEASTVHAEIWNQPFVPVERVVKENMTLNDLVTWLYWIFRGLDGGHLRLHSGHRFTLADIALAYPTAKIQRQFYDGAAYRASKQKALATTAEVAAEAAEEPG